MYISYHVNCKLAPFSCNLGTIFIDTTQIVLPRTLLYFPNKASPVCLCEFEFFNALCITVTIQYMLFCVWHM